MGRAPNQIHLGLLHGGRRYHRVSEWPGDCRRLHVRSHPAGAFQPGIRQGLRWFHLYHRLLRWLAHHYLPDGRASAQPWALYLRRHRFLSTGPEQGADLRSLRLADGGVLLPDRADGRCRPTDQIAVWPRLPGCGDDRWRADADLRDLRRNDRHHLGPDHQGCAVARRRHHPRGHGHVAVRFQL
ncbi:hypothetical protein D3C71_1380630 [compost metagenome]